SVDFFYTKLADLRVDLLSMASKNAKERADAIAKSTGDSIGGVKDASQGVFQVTQKNSTDVSDYGSYDTSTIEKKVTAIVRASFEVK
ncbi:MAG: SIMPL domain-containing protein, partial [Candidatus Pacebacteria bacterium]|nr:SIMPL domain-containing protein [Candidatus Paceibacterota bacterium]